MTYGEKITENELSSRTGLDLLARMIYAEAEGESEMGKRGVAFVARNRKDHSKASEFGGTTYKQVILFRNDFKSKTTARFLEPNLDSEAWATSLNIALNMDTMTNPISACLWFNTPAAYSANSRVENGQEQYNFGAGYKNVIEKKVLGNHIFFRVEGY